MKATLRKIFYIIILMFLFIIIKNVNVQAATASISASTTEPTEGQSVTVTANVTAGAWNLDFAGAGQSQKLYGYTQSNANASDSKTITFTAGSAGTTYTFTLTGDMTDISASNSEQVNEQVTITVKSTSNTGDNNSGGGTTSKSSEARLSNLGITPNDFSGFRRDTTTYTVEVPNSVSQVRIYATPLDSKATVSGTGTVSLKEGANSFKITVTAEAGNTKTYTLNITRVSATDNADDSGNKESEARLSNLGIRPEEYDFDGFKRDTTSYSVEVPNEVTEIEVYAEPVSSKAQVTGTGTVTLNEGVNKVEVKVTAEDGTEMVYTIEITRTVSTTEGETETNEELGLASLIIKNFNLSPEFDTKTYEYTIGLRENLSSLEIEAKANNSTATVEIIGNENLKDGENIITILVSNAETEEYATYQIIVNKNAESETAGVVNWLEPSTWGLKEKIIIGVAIALVIVIIIAIIIKVKLSKKEDEDLDLPGTDELDRALAEHQELNEETENETTMEADSEYRQYNDYNITNEEEKPKSDIEKAQEYFESYTKRKGKHF